MMNLLFCFKCNSNNLYHHVQTHSFPTRRSSDLPDEAGGGRGRRIDQIRETLTSARNMEKVAATTDLLPAGANGREKAGTVAMLQKNIKVVPQQDNIR